MTPLRPGWSLPAAKIAVQPELQRIGGGRARLAIATSIIFPASSSARPLFRSSHPHPTTNFCTSLLPCAGDYQNGLSTLFTVWLINAQTLKLEYFVGDKILRYAILSHTWGDWEVSFAEFSAPNGVIRAKEGYAKIHQTCRLALAEQLNYAWADTCCIDKSRVAPSLQRVSTPCISDITMPLYASRFFSISFPKLSTRAATRFFNMRTIVA